MTRNKGDGGVWQSDIRGTTVGVDVADMRREMSHRGGKMGTTKKKRMGVVPAPDEKKLPSGYHNYPLKGLNLRYMYCIQKHFSE